MTSTRWVVLAMLFFATTINYLDRIVFSVLIPVIRQELSLNDEQYGLVNMAFQVAYMIGFLFMGKLIDRVGTRLGYAISVIWWSIAAMLHATARSALGLSFWRAMLGLGESGNFPAAVKAVAEWFPKQDRAFATGIFNAGTNVASMIGPPLFAWMVGSHGLGWNWRMCFLITGASGFLWLVFWLSFRKKPNAAELAYIRSDAPDDAAMRQVGWRQALGYRQSWGFALAKFFTDPVWWFYLYWLPPYLYDVRKLDLKQIGWALPVVYLMADVGSVAGGWFAGFLIRRGWRHDKARKFAMLVCALMMPVASMAALAPNTLLAVALVSLATSAHQGLSANLYTTISDVFPKNAVASVIGIGGCAGGLGGTLFSTWLAGWVVTYFGYTPLILGMGVFHLIAVLMVHRFMGDLKPLTMEGQS
ncbi:MAG: MFS transporter [Bryobacteraceae bacterium]|nr:MFS transporter [Bryobacteraceae bacterium]MDW8380072.1 MFS transporter [Bryobacterales bacterium]